MVLIGVWLLLTNTIGIETTDFALLVMNSRSRMKMLLLEEEKIWLTTTLGKRSKSNSYSIACLLKARTRGIQNLMISWLPVYWSSSQRYHVEVICTPPPCLVIGWVGFRVKQQPLMSSSGHSETGTRTACLWHKMCCLEGCYQALWGYHHQGQEIASRG